DPLDASAVAPFVCIEYEGKKGTIAVMGDGKVRFIPASISNDAFRGLCAINGDKPSGSLDSIAPEIPPPEGGESTLQAQPIAPPTDTKPAADPKPAPDTKPAAEATPADGWQKVESAAGRFSVMMRGKVTEPATKKEAAGPLGQIDFTIQAAKNPDSKQM